MAGIGTFISVGRSFESALDRVRQAEALGFDSVYTTHVAARDSLSVLMAYASVSKRIRIGTGVLPAFSRTRSRPRRLRPRSTSSPAAAWCSGSASRTRSRTSTGSTPRSRSR